MKSLLVCVALISNDEDKEKEHPLD